MTSSKDKTIMRSLGEFFGYIAKGVKTDPAKEDVRERAVHGLAHDLRQDQT